MEVNGELGAVGGRGQDIGVEEGDHVGFGEGFDIGCVVGYWVMLEGVFLFS